MLAILAFFPIFVAILLLLVFKWNMCDAGWGILSVTILLVSLVPAFHRTPWQIALSLGEGSAKMLTMSIILLPALFFYQMQSETGAIGVLMKTWRRSFPAIVAITSFFSIAALMKDSGMIDALGKAAAMLGKNYVRFTSSLWLGGIVILLTLLIIANIPVISVIASRFGKCLREICNTLMPVFSSACEAKTKLFHYLTANWAWKVVGYGGLLLVNVLYASYSLVSMGPLSRIDPVLFVCFQTLPLVPIGFVLLVKTRRYLNREEVYRGLQLGGFLSAELLCYTHSLKDTRITEAMIFSTVNGVVATFIAWKVFGQRISILTKWACLFALGGVGIVWSISPARWQGDFSAFISGMCMVGYCFHLEQLLAEARQCKQRLLSIMGIQFLVMALITLVIALCFGQWQTIHFLVPSDFAALMYLSLATILVPCLIMFMMQRTFNAITIAFFSAIEPLAGVGFAFFSTGERLPTFTYIGGGIAIVGIVLQGITGAAKNIPVPAAEHK